MRCSGFLARTPCFDFLYRSGGVCDLRGEKLHTGQAERLIAELERRFALFSFAMLIPAQTLDRYIFQYDCAAPQDPAAMTDAMEDILKRNIYYNDARCKGQLKPVEPRFRPGAMETFRALKQGVSGGVKPPPLFIPPDGNASSSELWGSILEI